MDRKIKGWIMLGVAGLGIVLVVVGVHLIGITQINLVTGKQSSPDLVEGIVLIGIALSLFTATRWVAAKW
jgi:hypothetical protein